MAGLVSRRTRRGEGPADGLPAPEDPARDEAVRARNRRGAPRNPVTMTQDGRITSGRVERADAPRDPDGSMGQGSPNYPHGV